MRTLLLSFLLLICTAALADEAGVKRLFESKFNGAKVSSVSKTSYGGLYEVYFDGQIGYTDEQVDKWLAQAPGYNHMPDVEYPFELPPALAAAPRKKGFAPHESRIQWRSSRY